MKLYLDFETSDPFISEGLGAGWVFKDSGRFKFLCAGYKWGEGEVVMTSSRDELAAIVAASSELVAHNAQYELGVLHFLSIPYDHLLVVDTLLLAKLFDNTLFSYGLNDLSKKYLGEAKTEDGLGEVAKDLGLVKSKVQNPVTIAKRNMLAVYDKAPEVVHKYCAQDVELLHSLHLFYDKNLYEVDLLFYSDLIKALVGARSRGVRVDLDRARHLRMELWQKMQQLEEQKEDLLPNVNINSPLQLAAFFDQQGIDYPRTDKGNPSITKEWLALEKHPACVVINKIKKYNKVVRDFLDPMIGRGQENDNYAVVYPEINIFGAAATGRASASNPNIQQFPKRDPEVGSIIRSMFVPHEGEMWYSLDFSSQEPRMAVHYAALLGAPGADGLVEAYNNNFKHDLHRQAALLMGLGEEGRNQAKTINLGLAYGMGVRKLAESLKVPVPKAQYLLQLFHSKVPYLKVLDTLCRRSISSRGYIKTVGGRRLRNGFGDERKALNKLIQGSSADQTWAALVQAYREGIKVLFPVHDELCLSTSDPKEAERLREIMETCVPLKVPSYVEVTSGKNWGDSK